MPYEYEDGLLSNSMLQTALFCRHKYQKLYVERADISGYTAYGALFTGTVTHECIELHDNNTEALEAHAWKLLLAEWGEDVLTIKPVFEQLKLAKRHIDTVYASKGWEQPKAHTMTNMFKREYGFILEQLAQFDARLRDKLETDKVIFERNPSEIIEQIFTALSNWPAMRIADAMACELVIKSEIYYPAKGETVLRGGTIDRVEKRGLNKVAICDYKTGRWGYTPSKVVNSDQFGLYDAILRGPDYQYTVVEWVLYDLIANQCIRIKPTPEIRQAAELRDRANVSQYLNNPGPGPVPAGGPGGLGCPCILATTGDCPYYVPAD